MNGVAIFININSIIYYYKVSALRNFKKTSSNSAQPEKQKKGHANDEG